MSDVIFGEGPVQTITPQEQNLPPGYETARAFFHQIFAPMMAGRLPTYPGSIDPGLNPTMQTALRMGQGYAGSPAPQIMGQAQGTLSSFMNPQLSSAGWGTGQAGPQYVNTPQPNSPVGPGSYNPWANPYAPSPTPYRRAGAAQQPQRSPAAAGNPAVQQLGGPSRQGPGQMLGPPVSAPGPTVGGAGFGKGDSVGGSGGGPAGILGPPVRQGGGGPGQMLGPPNQQGADYWAYKKKMAAAGGMQPQAGPGQMLGPPVGQKPGFSPQPAGGPGRMLGPPQASKPFPSISPRPGGPGQMLGPPVQQGGGSPPERRMPPVGQPPASAQGSPFRRMPPQADGGPGRMLGPPQAQGGFNPQMAGGPSRQGGPGQMLGPPQAQGGPVRQMGGPQQAGGPVQQMTPNTPAMPASIWDVYNSAIPVMQMERDRNIGQSLSQAGFNGTRFSTGAQNNVAQIGADTALRQNELLANLMYGQGQSDADRALQATGQGMQLGNQIEQMNRNRIGDLFNMGAWEQQRGDSLAQAPYQDYQANMRGWLPELLSLIGAQGAASYVPPITTTQGGSPGLLDYASQVPWYMFAA